MAEFDEFIITDDETETYRKLVRLYEPSLIAEFGSGNTTRFWAEETNAKIISWDNTSAWLEHIRSRFASAPWLDRVEFRHYDVTPTGGRKVSKQAVPYVGPKFDMVFVDGPRSAHDASFGRSGSFAFACRHIKPGGLIVWHDNDRLHERALALRYCGHCFFRGHRRVGWCRWTPLERTTLLTRFLLRGINRIQLLCRPARG